MARSIALLAASLLFPLSAAATSSSTVGTLNCSGNPTVSLLDTASFLCSGNFLLSGGSITSESGIVIRADGSLTLDNILITAPFVELTSLGGQMTIGDGVSINSDSFLAGTGDAPAPILRIAPGATLSVGTGFDLRIIGGGEILGWINSPVIGGDVTVTADVPEPRTFGSMALGLLIVSGVIRARRRRQP